MTASCGWLMKNVAENKILVSWRSRHFFCSSLFFVRPSWWERKRDYLEQIWRLKKLVQRRKDSETRISAPKKGLLGCIVELRWQQKTSSERKNRKKICLRMPFNHFLSLHFHFQISKGLTDEPQTQKSKTFLYLPKYFFVCNMYIVQYSPSLIIKKIYVNRLLTVGFIVGDVPLVKFWFIVCRAQHT